MNLPMKYLIFLYVMSSCAFAQQKVELSVKLINPTTSPKYIYWLHDKEFQKATYKDTEIIFRSNEYPYKDSLIRGRLVLTDQNMASMDDYSALKRKGTIAWGKNLFDFLIDTSHIAISIDYKNHEMQVSATELNEQFRENEILTREYNRHPEKYGKTIDELNDWHLLTRLNNIQKYPRSKLSAFLIKTEILGSSRAYHNSEAIRSTIATLNPEAVGAAYITSLNAKLDNILLRNSPKKNQPFPALTLQKDSGSPHTINDISEGSDFLIIDFWATWCGPCRAQQPEFARIAKRYEDRENVKFMAVSLDKDRTAWTSHTTAKPFAYASFWLDQKKYASVLDELGITSIPRYMIVHVKKNIIIDPQIAIGDLEKKISELGN